MEESALRMEDGRDYSNIFLIVLSVLLILATAGMIFIGLELRDANQEIETLSGEIKAKDAQINSRGAEIEACIIELEECRE